MNSNTLYSYSKQKKEPTHTETHKMPESFSECKECTLGRRFIILASNNYPAVKIINIISMACKGDKAGTIYRHYIIGTCPCTCDKGLYINESIKKYKYPPLILDRLFKHSFPDITSTNDFINKKVSKIKSKNCQTIQDLEKFWNDSPKWQQEDPDFKKLINHRKKELS